MAADKPTSPRNVFGYVYLVRNMANGMVYVGQTTWTPRLRWDRHCCDARRGVRRFPLLEAIREFGPESFQVFELGCTSTKDDLDAMELSLVAMYNAADPETGYNVRRGGKGGGHLAASTRETLRELNRGKTPWNKGRPMPPHQLKEMLDRFRTTGHPRTGGKLSDEAKKKIGAANRVNMLGRKRSDESRRKQSETMLKRYEQIPPEERKAWNAFRVGIPLSEETRLKISSANLGKPVSEETRAKISESLRGNVPWNKGRAAKSMKGDNQL